MSIRTLKILHVEDEDSQRRLVSHHLQTLDDFHCEVQYADSEEAALGLFESGEMEFVILDYNLRQGDGLHCLEEMRSRDPIVPIIAISGAATAEVAADMVQAGVDGYISKRELTSGVLARCMREALERADACRRRTIGRRP